MLQVQDPGGVSSVSPLTTLRILPSPLRDRVGHLTTDRFRGYSFHLRYGLLPPCLRFETVVPTHTLRMGGPRAPQNSVPGCWLGITGATIAGHLALCASRRTSHRSVRAGLPHTAPRIMDSLRGGTRSGPPVRVGAGTAQVAG